MKPKAKPSITKLAEVGDVETLRNAVRQGVGLLDDMEDTSPLAIAVERGDVPFTRELIKLGHKPDVGGIVVPLALAATSGNTEIINLLLESGADVNAKGEEGETALMCAAGAGQLNAVKRLIEAGARIRQKDSGAEDALDYAVRGKSDSVIEFLLPHFPQERREILQRQAHLRKGREKHSQITERLEAALARKDNKVGKRGSLIPAYESGQTQKVLELLSSGADPNETNKEGTTILTMVASGSGNEKILRKLLEAGADPNRGTLFRPLNSAASNGAKFVRLLLQAGADPKWADPDGGTPLMSAAFSDDPECLRLLLEAGADPNAEDHDGRTAYWYALQRNDKDVVELLARVTSDVDDAQVPWRKNKEGKSVESCLIEAASAGDLQHVTTLLAERVRVDSADEGGDTALHVAASGGHVEVVRALLKAGAPIEAQNLGSETPLICAAKSGSLETVRVLLAAGAEINAHKGDILCYACENEQCLPLVELLLGGGAKVNISGGFRRATPLHVAIEKNQNDVVRRLLEAGASVSKKDPNGWTPFLTAALRAGLETVKLLIDSGSDVKAVDKEGRNAHDLASSWGKKDVAAFLKTLLGK